MFIELKGMEEESVIVCVEDIMAIYDKGEFRKICHKSFAAITYTRSTTKEIIDRCYGE